MNKMVLVAFMSIVIPAFSQEKVLNETESQIVKQLYKIAQDEGWFFSRYGVFTVNVTEFADSLTQWQCSIIFENNVAEERPFAYSYIGQIPIFFYGKFTQTGLQEIEKIAHANLYVKSPKINRSMPLTHDMFRDGVARKDADNKIIMVENRMRVVLDNDHARKVLTVVIDRNNKIVKINR
jgi:hypothetical protein